jgi:hypothetical protein
MKKLLLPLLCIGFTALTVQGQELKKDQRGSTTFGIKGGINQALINDSSTSADLGYYFGLFSETRLSKKWSLQNELLFTANTEVTSNPFNELNSEETRELTFFEVPVHLKYYITDKLSVFAGPKLSFLAAGQADNVGLAIDAGIQYDVSNKLFIEARYSQDLFTQNTVFDGNSIFGTDNSLNQVRLGVGYKF